MKNTKMLKAVCKKSGKHFALEIKQYGGEWKIVNFLDIGAEEASLMSSEIRQPSFSTADFLQACERCGGRKAGGCKCAPSSYSCRADGRYNFQCVYCNNLEIDYSAPELGGRREGEVIRLEQGQEFTIKAGDAAIKRITVGMGWDPAGNSAEPMDLDSSVIVAGSGGYETVYFSALRHPSGCVVHHGDNLTGIDVGPNRDDENISVDLGLVPPDRDRLIFVINIYHCEERRQTLGTVKNMYIRLYDPDSHKTLVEYKVDGNLRSSTALVIGMASRRGGEWVFRAIGKGSNAKSVHALADEVSGLR